MKSENGDLDRPIFIIGAGRSGTTMIRETLMQHKDVAAFEYEMNYLWRYGNDRLTHDLLDPDVHLNSSISSYIKKAFLEEAETQGKARVLDKTVANVMRPAFIQKVFPNALFVHVIRDGRAVTASAMKRWSEPQAPRYFASKMKTIPLKTLPRVGFRYIKNRVIAVFRGRNYRQSWGPRWVGIDEAVRDLPLEQVCARQWVKSVETALMQKSSLLPNSYMEVRYEELVQKPEVHFENIRKFLCLEENANFTKWINTQIDSGRREKWLSQFSEDKLAMIESEAGALLKKLEYT